MEVRLYRKKWYRTKLLVQRVFFKSVTPILSTIKSQNALAVLSVTKSKILLTFPSKHDR